jgi:predicted nucleic acid-binding protein
MWILNKASSTEFVGDFRSRKSPTNSVEEAFSQNYHALFTTETPTLCVVKKDPADDKFLECAVAQHAKYVISGDRALLAVERYMNIRIVNPLEYLEMVKKIG